MFATIALFRENNSKELFQFEFLTKHIDVFFLVRNNGFIYRTTFI